LLEEALDPELSREEPVLKVKEIQSVASGEAEEGQADLESAEEYSCTMEPRLRMYLGS